MNADCDGFHFISAQIIRQFFRLIFSDRSFRGTGFFVSVQFFLLRLFNAPKSHMIAPPIRISHSVMRRPCSTLLVSMTVIKCKKTAVKFCSFMAAVK
ncbi:MAG: hypothetical protein VB018_14795 [Lachnospiraceae bacterium]|nr:hypothetical protein [Lachnospiraceae bacterium]